MNACLCLSMTSIFRIATWKRWANFVKLPKKNRFGFAIRLIESFDVTSFRVARMRKDDWAYLVSISQLWQKKYVDLAMTVVMLSFKVQWKFSNGRESVMSKGKTLFFGGWEEGEWESRGVNNPPWKHLFTQQIHVSGNIQRSSKHIRWCGIFWRAPCFHDNQSSWQARPSPHTARQGRP